MAEIRFFVRGTPKSWKETQFNRKTGHAYKPKQNVIWQTSILGQAMPHAPATPFDCPLRVDLEFVFAIPISWPQWKREWALQRVRTGKLVPYLTSDRENLMKAVFDALEGPFWVNDRIVVTGPVTKRYGVEPGVWVTIVPLRPLPQRKSDLVPAPESVPRTCGPSAS